MNTLLFFAVFAGLALFYTILGFLASSKIKTTADYFLAGRDLGLFPTTMTLVATQIGGGMLLGTSENAYSYGLYGILYTIGMTIGFIFLSAGIASRLQSLQVATTAQVFETYYDSPFLKRVASALSVITLCGILIGQVVGSRSIIDTLGLGASTELIFILFWIFIIAYTVVGGLKAVVITDVFQVLLIIFIFSAVFIYATLYGPAFNWADIFIVQKQQFGTLPLSLNALVATITMPALFSLIEQDLAQRFFAARTARIATLSAICSCVFMILFALIPIYFGMQAKLMGLAIPTGESPLIPVISLLANEFVVILCLCAIVAAITSTADSLLCAISSNIAQDFEFGWFGQHNALNRSKWITLIVGSIALGASYIVPQNIITILIDSYAISVSCLLVPLLAAYFSKKVSKQAAIISIGAGLVTFLLIPFWQTELPKVLLPLIVSAIGYIVGGRFTTFVRQA